MDEIKTESKDQAISNKTLADILAEMRGNEFDDPHLDADGIIGARILAKGWAARIEAALKREKSEIEASALSVGGIVEAARNRNVQNTSKNTGVKLDISPVGNAAKLREALMYAEQVLDTAARNVRGETGMVINSAYSEAARKCRAALAAPVRNCDRFYTVKDAAIAFTRERQDAPQPCPDFTFSAWLFAGAKKGEGGAK